MTAVERIGNYRIDGELAQDAAGIVYEARHLVLPRRAIIKVMQPAQTRPRAIQLLREACLLEALEHPGILRVYESGLLPDRRPWFAHERVDGGTVAELLASGPLEPSNAAALLRDIADVLDHAHRRGVIHGGVRPDRIVITGRSRGFPLCLVDWSQARVHDTTAPLPEPDSDYGAPELADRDAGGIDDRSDVFALGVIAYQALTGELPAEQLTASGEIQRVPAEVGCPEAPPELTRLVDQMLAWERFDRPSCTEVIAVLRSLAVDLARPPVDPSLPASSLRIRRPRWTPSLPLPDGEQDLSAREVTADDTSEQPS